MTGRAWERIRALGLWQGDVEISPLKGGISNESWIVQDAAGRWVVRFGDDYPFHHVERRREVMVARAAAEAGFAPALRHAAEGVMVTDYLGAKTFEASDVRAAIGPIADLLRRFHRTMPHHVSGPGFFFWPFHVVRDYARTLRRDGSRMTAELPRYLALADALEAVQVPLPIVFAHNDLLPANLLHDGQRLWLIDFEYAGFSTALFDLAGLSSNAGFSPEETEALLTAYFGCSPDPALSRAMAAMQCASLLREAMWSMVSELHLNAPGTDYPAYTAANLARLEAALDAYQTAYGTL
ncbi:putative choline kinase involved in LPS biosynthesis [Rubellimicrobium thermophilum DSM 16684]|uniref:Putative choline kinase involved in LPS biosynthesis n=1 Tax=Rubellimicrobium thermophilum DSM 16684 TaxID=1123069 RepID=S9R3N4_9RHOB|nr:LPS biosynthesis choline kinase [Rubellimicrobium thermophilum]EPX86522.1 putative choline kinase involved in LPS biosynthesis [Rubellimicrobium thermophilum DSM 16684]